MKEPSNNGRHVVSAVARILTSASWDRTLGPAPRMPDDPPMSSPQGSAVSTSAESSTLRSSELAVATGRAIELMLEPWLEGRRAMNYDAFTDLFEWIRDGMETPSHRARIQQILASYEPRGGEPSGAR